jgi:hypothetical protein
MEFKPVSLSLIEQSMLDFLKSNTLRDGTGQAVAEFDARKGIVNINKTPAICVATESVGYQLKDESTVEWSPTIMLYLVFKNVSSEDARRKGAYPILQGAVELLQLQDLGLDIDPLVPGPRGEEILNSALEQSGLIGFKVPFTTNFDVSKYQAETEAVKLIQSGITYYSKQADGSQVIAGTDEVNLQE